MPETREVRSVVDAAEQAAADGDYASAERLLREAASLQEASLGPLHPDLANTLNNLGVVCEITDKPIDAEHCFRRAFAIATAALQPDHPFVATSRKNLEDFCQARGIAVAAPVQPPAVATEPDASAISRPVASRSWSRPLAIAALIAVGLLVSFIGTASWFRSNDEVESPLANPSVSPPESPTLTAPPPPADPIPTDAPKESSVPSAAAVKKKPPASTLVAAAAHLCRNLSTDEPDGSSSDWQCVPPSLPAGPGTLFFYTRVKSPTDTTVQHRWYRGDRLRQVVELSIRANPTGGYRTYSRNTINNQGAAEWRVELRASDGTLLHEERFAVR
jgi:Protein of unknown function (DUF2914)/Tetratricopeptide repeat